MSISVLGLGVWVSLYLLAFVVAHPFSLYGLPCWGRPSINDFCLIKARVINDINWILIIWYIEKDSTDTIQYIMYDVS